MEHKGGCRSGPPCVLPLTPAASPPLAFAAAPLGQLKPSGALPVGGDFIAQRETPVKGAVHGFAATPLTGVSRCAFYELPTEQIAQRACSQHEPTWWSALSDSTVYIQTFMVQAAGFRIAVTSSSAGRKRTYSERMLKCAFGSLLIRYSTSAINLD